MKKFTYISFIAAGLLLISCNGFLNLEPITDVSTEAYLHAEADLAAYSARFYQDGYSELPSHGSGSYNLGLFRIDNGTDNQTADAPSALFVPKQTRVGDSSHWSDYFEKIRAANYFLNIVVDRYDKGEISGFDPNIRHYIGEMYFFRALVYFKALQEIGDFPILTELLPDDYQAVRTASQRRPRNEVARFILSDLDKATGYLKDVAPMSNRVNRDCAMLLKSRVGLFEGTWEKYHKGTAFVPGGPEWPGAKMDYLKSFTINIDEEINYFLTRAVAAADSVASTHTLHSDYTALFNSVDLSGIPEILLWRAYGVSSNATSFHYVVGYIQRNGGGNAGFTRSMVDSYLMANGLPIYAEGSGYHGDSSYAEVFEGRDPRMGHTILKTGDLLADDATFNNYIKSDDKGYYYRGPIFETSAENGNVTGYSLKKGLNPDAAFASTKQGYTGCPVFRAAEAYLNYIEAYYELNGKLSGNCGTYWKALRQRAGVSQDYQATIDKTDMSKEKLDWGSYSAGKQVDATLYNIRRERRIELAAEGYRLNDLKRWRALDQLNNFHVQGINFWDNNYKLYTEPNPEDMKEGVQMEVIELIQYGDGGGKTPNISAKTDPNAEGKYVLPYRKNEANIGFNGLTWNKAKYLNPISNTEFRLTTDVPGSNDFETSSIYQNPGWSKIDGSLPEGE